MRNRAYKTGGQRSFWADILSNMTGDQDGGTVILPSEGLKPNLPPPDNTPLYIAGGLMLFIMIIATVLVIRKK